MSLTLPSDTPEKEQERELCILLYKALREYTGHDLPWGILTGVRPVKVISALTDAQAEQKIPRQRKEACPRPQDTAGAEAA